METQVLGGQGGAERRLQAGGARDSPGHRRPWAGSEGASGASRARAPGPAAATDLQAQVFPRPARAEDGGQRARATVAPWYALLMRVR